MRPPIHRPRAGHPLRDRCRAQGVTVRSVAHALGLSEGVVYNRLSGHSSWVRGARGPAGRIPTGEAVARAAELLAVSPAWLAGALGLPDVSR